MRLLSTLLIVSCLAISCLASAADAQDAAAAWAALRAGGDVALIRHAGTVGGSGDPPEFRLEDCATQRNLTLKGKAEARRLGDLFRSGGVSVGKVLSSQWCRCVDTVTLMGLGTPELAPTLNNAFTFRDRVEELTAGARTIVAEWSGPGTLVAVTHGANILPLTGIMPEEGGVVVVKADPASASRLRVLGKIPVPAISGQ
jgi:phosphohistidine phosphatase SixA